MTTQVSTQDAVRFAWEALRLLSSTAKATNFSTFFTADSNSDDSLFWVTIDLLRQAGLIHSIDRSQIYHNMTIRAAVREVFYSAVSIGLIVPGQLGQGYAWNADQGTYQFTVKGREFFQHGTVSISIPGQLVTRVNEISDAGHLDPGIAPLVAEAQQCWMMGCLRAAMVMIGLASEGTLMGLIDELQNYQIPPNSGTTNWNDWNRIKNEALAFYPRWQSSVALLENIKQQLQRAYRGTRPDWWSIWEPLPGGIEPFGECIRIARNAAAHSVGDVFTNAQVGLLLASLPTMLEVVSGLTAFLHSPPSGITLPNL